MACNCRDKELPPLEIHGEERCRVDDAGVVGGDGLSADGGDGDAFAI